ncbi:MAG: amidohydrolase family protein [Candidatus Bathyarchaeota archaeon]|nr:MAG: amidohydrolase family protein [Candidatus Bathyarchaeota archaeon]
MRNLWKYTGPIFDAHTHIRSIETTSKMIAIEDEHGVSKQIGIVHDEEGFKKTKEQYPSRFVFAKYLSLSDIAQYNVEPVLDEISELLDQGYSMAKTWFGPRWRDFIENVPRDFRINHPNLYPIYEALEDNDIPLIIHVSDPDTYYLSQYRDSEKYGFKDDHLRELENVLSRYNKLRVQIPHLGAQPEIHRLSHLSGWLDKYPNVVLDTASSRWMARELSKDTKKAREFMITYSDRVLFGTDVFGGRGEREYYSGRYLAQRILWETDERNTPLPIPDADTVKTGGTFINGLDLPLDVLRKLYWENADRIYSALS